MTEKHSLDGSPVYLREFTDDDVTDRYLAWFNDPSFTHFLETKSLTRQAALDHLHSGQISKSYIMYAIILKDTDQHVGNIKLGPIDQVNGLSDLSTIIGEKDCWGKGMGRAAIKIANHLAFSRHGIRKLSAKIRGDNYGSIKAYTGAGWVIEGRLVDHIIADGRPQDAVLVSCFNTSNTKG